MNLSSRFFVPLAFFISLITPVSAAISSPESLEVAQQSGTPLENAGAAEEIYKEGLQLYKQGTVESLQQVIAKWEEAFKLWQEVGNRSEQATTLTDIGTIAEEG